MSHHKGLKALNCLLPEMELSDCMESFNELDKQDADLAKLKALLQIVSIRTHCVSINSVLIDNKDSGEIYCLWGQFSVSREEIRCGESWYK
ncbi:hypothetical protein A3195_01915 [Candidatus Thiodiazotropha endoloripes]|nr:hypothetical protein A3193_00140 [Candidatus Thiodiazotropha endoloripes]ODB90272.1 hypothetical protein A3195_01915 [Candidatus Thiodiazotropha endoloripes]